MTQKVVTNDEAYTGSKHFFCYFRYFWKVYRITNIRGTFVENVKQVKNQATLLTLYSILVSAEFRSGPSGILYDGCATNFPI
jgi:hypothetical protein